MDITPFLLIALGITLSATAHAQLEADTIPTPAGNLTITFIGHGSLAFTFNGKVIHVDPYGKLTDYARLPKADAILITHDHYDHLDPDAVKAVRQAHTAILLPASCADRIPGGTVMANGATNAAAGVTVEAVPAYNLVHGPSKGQVFHPKGAGNGYILTFGGTRVYVAGDTENTPEMKALKDIEVAFLPMNLPYTMTPEMVADAARAFKPKILYPYHFGDTDPAKLKTLLKGTPDIEVRIRKMK